MKKKRSKAIERLRKQLKPEYGIRAFTDDYGVDLTIDRDHLDLLQDFMEGHVKLYGATSMNVGISSDKSISEKEMDKFNIALIEFYDTLAIKPDIVNGDKDWNNREG